MILMSPRLIMEPQQHGFALKFADWLNDPEVVRYSEQRHRKHDTQTQLDYWYSSATAAPNILRFIAIREPHSVIGSITAQIDPYNGVADVGILIGDKSKWGQGYGYEAWECFCNYLFYEKKIRKIEAGCMDSNIGMGRIFSKFRMTHEGSKKGHFILDGKPENMTMYGKFQ